MKTKLALLLAAALSLPAFQDKKDHGKTPELTKQFVACMEASKKEVKGLEADIAADKPEAELKKRLAAIRVQSEKARALKYMKDEEKAELLDNHFEIFLLKLKIDFEEKPWDTKDTRLNLFERLNAKCGVCHEECRD
jgi:Sec-independent protein translocase protein TatA